MRATRLLGLGDEHLAAVLEQVRIADPEHGIVGVDRDLWLGPEQHFSIEPIDLGPCRQPDRVPIFE